MSATTATNNSTTTQQRLQQREKERQQRGLQFQDNSVPFLQIANGNVLFSEPIKHEHEDATAKRIKDAFGEFNHMKDLINNASGHKQLVGISTSLSANRAKINNQNKAKIEAIFFEMKNNIQPLTGLDDTELPPTTNSNNHTINSSVDNKETLSNQLNNYPPDTNHHRKEPVKLKELNSNSSPAAMPNKLVNNLNSHKASSNKTHPSSSAPTNHNHHSSLANYSTNEHSDQELDEVSDESQSPNVKNELINSGLSRLNNQITKYSTTNRPPSERSTSSSINNKPLTKRNLELEQDENHIDELSDDSLKRKRRKSDPQNNSLLKAIVNNHIGHYAATTGNQEPKDLKEENVAKEANDSSASSESDSDSASGSSSGSSGSSSSSEQEEGDLSDNESISSLTKEKSKTVASNKSEILNRIDKNITAKESTNNGCQKITPVTKVAVVSATQQQKPQRSWALSSFATKLNSNDKQVTSSHKSPPISINNHPPTKAQLKQQPLATNVLADVIERNSIKNSKNSIDPVKFEEKSSTTDSKKLDYCSDDSDSSSSSSGLISDRRKTENKCKPKSNSRSSAKRDKPDRRTKRSLSPQLQDLSDLDEQLLKNNKKSSSVKPKNKRPDKHDKGKNQKIKEEPPQIMSEQLDRYSPSSASMTSPLVKKEKKSKEKDKRTKALPTSLCVSIDLSTLDKKKPLSSKKESQDQKANSNKENAKENKKDKESNYKDKYRSSCDRSEKKSSKSKLKNDKYDRDRHSDKYGDDKANKLDKHDKSEKSSVKSDKNAGDKPEGKHDKNEKEKSKKIKEQDEKFREKDGANKRKSTKDDEDCGSDKREFSSKHKKSKQEFSKKEEGVEKRKSEKEDRLKESIKNELFEKPLASNESNEFRSSKNKEPAAKSSPILSVFRDKENRESKEKESKKDNLNSSGKETNQTKTNLETFYNVEGKRWKHTADREKDPTRQSCQYFEASIYFIQSARQFERNNDTLSLVYRNFMNTLQFVRPALLNKFVKSRTHSADESKLTILGLRCLSLTIFHLMKILNREMRANDKYIRSQIQLVSANADPSKPDQPTIVNNKMQLPMQLFSMMKKQLDYLSYYNESVELWQQADNMLENDSSLKSFFKKLNVECGRLSLDSNIDDLVPYARAGLKLLNVDYSG